MIEKVLYRTKRPILFYAWIIITLGTLVTFIFKLGFISSTIFTSGIISGILYYLLCRKSCKVYVYEGKMEICYTFFWDQKKEISFDDIIELDYKKGFFDFSAPFENTYHFKLICYDTFFIKLKTKSIQININTRMGGFNHLKRILTEKIREH